MEDGEHAPVAGRVEELVAVPAGRERSGLGLAVTDDARDDQVRVIERGAVGVRQRVAELAALVNRSGRLRRHVARDAAGKAELLEEQLQALLVLRDPWIYLAVRALEVSVRDESRPAVSGADDVDHVEVMPLDDP